jgi:hypothetical protein
MKTKFIFAIVLISVGALLFLSRTSASASPSQQVAYPSPTPGPDGKIIYTVKAGDTCERLSILYGISVEYIRTSNLLDENCSLREGQPLLLGIAAVPTATSPAESGAATPTQTVTPTPEPGTSGTAQICVLVYDDVNGDGLRQETEGAIAGAALSLTNPEGTISQTKITVINPDPTAYQGMCFTDIPPGKYSISAAVPDGYNPTVDLNSSFDVIAGDVDSVNFGAQVKVAPTIASPTKGPSPLMGIIGAALLLGGVGLGVYAWRIMRKN